LLRSRHRGHIDPNKVESLLTTDDLDAFVDEDPADEDSDEDTNGETGDTKNIDSDRGLPTDTDNDDVTSQEAYASAVEYDDEEGEDSKLEDDDEVLEVDKEMDEEEDEMDEDEDEEEDEEDEEDEDSEDRANEGEDGYAMHQGSDASDDTY